MKKIVILLALVGITTASFAQSDFKRFHFGLKVVPGLYWASTDETGVQSNGSVLGFGYGALLEFGFTENYSLATGFDINTIGQKITWNFTNTGGSGSSGSYANTIDMTLQYIQLPLMIKMKTNDISGFRYFGQFGLNTGVNISAKTTSNLLEIASQKTTITETTSKSDVFLLREALLIGIGLEYNLAGSTNLVAAVNFDNGFTGVLSSTNSVNDKINNPSILSKGVTLTVGILF